MSTATSRPTRIYARWADHLSLSLPDHSLPVPAHAYDVPIPIGACPELGERVQIIALSPMAYRTMHTPLGTQIYDVYDPQVEGVVEGVCWAGPSRVAFAVKNERLVAGVPWVVVTMPFDRWAMKLVAEEDCPPGWLRTCLSTQRSEVEVQDGAVVVDKLGDDPTPPVSLQYPDPRVWQHDRLLTDRADE
ncbi:hypothetical protein C8T65DRAFT_735752 [Cerioporus squamosus]|nr:hypothetical protein C8T65DRAFT_735752 [Cerioporus squamosus]